MILEDKYISKIKDSSSTFIAVCDGDVVIDECDFGVISLLKHYDTLYKCKNLVIYDKLIGKGASMIIDSLNVNDVYVKTITSDALNILSNINVSFDIEVEKILNRDKSDLCPIEKIAKNINEVDELINVLRAFYIERGYLND